MTIAEKILAAHTDQEAIEVDDLIEARLDFVFANDITAPMAIEVFRKSGGQRLFDPERVGMIPDHFIPSKDIQSAAQAKLMRTFALEQKLSNYFEVGRTGIEHVLLPEQGLALPGDLIIGASSHTCTCGALGAFSTGVGSMELATAMITGISWFRVPASIKIVFKGQRRPWVGGKDLILHTIGQIGMDGARYKAMEFVGPVIETLPMADRFSMCSMANEAGAKVGIIAPDEITKTYVKNRAKRDYKFFASDPDADYQSVIEFDVSELGPQVACPHSPQKVKPVEELTRITIDQAVIGSCTNGRLEDMQIAAKILKGKKVEPHTRLIIIPATPSIYRQIIKEGLMEIFLDAEAVVSTPSCGPCLRGYTAVMAEGERTITTTNRNFAGRMGHIKSEIYLSSPAVAAASAVLGRIAHPDEVCKIK